MLFFYFFFVFSGTYIQKYKVRINEGELRAKELKFYLEKIGAPNSVWLSEDGSGIVQRAVYDVHSNKIVGLNLPLDRTSGMPLSSQYEAKTLGDIENHMQNQLSSLVYVIIAQPIQPNAAPFVLQLYGTNNKFSSADVANRWKFTMEKLDE